MSVARQSAAKRSFDLLISAFALLALAPVILLISVLVKLDSKGPVLFADTRAGVDGKAFPMLKFRSMVVGAESMGLGREVAADDERITRVGRVLREWTLDEVPQLFNVLRGDMSIVGPRPATPEQTARLTSQQCRRLDVRPGMAGWAWIHGRNGIPWSKRIELDLWYVDRHTFGLDMLIIVRSVMQVFRRDSVYGTGGITLDVPELSDEKRT